jgi:D-glucuronyl C5-epimerase C-terminus/Bacterial Ig-like domain
VALHLQGGLQGRREAERSIERVRWPSVAGLALAGVLLLTGTASARPPASSLPAWRVLVLDHGRVHVRVDRYAPGVGSDPVPAAAGVRALRATGGLGSGATSGPRASASVSASRRTVASELQRMLTAHAISTADYSRHLADYNAARRSVGRISGTRHDELAAVVANLDRVAAQGLLTVSRLPALFETLNRNRQWWTTGPLLSSGDRAGFTGSRLVWEYYPGQGIEIQWLGTFGKANGYFISFDDTALTALLDEAIGLANIRAGGLAWEYEFQFDGGSPPWVSALAQGTAIQALSRAGHRLGKQSYLDVAHRALGIFRSAPPLGIAVRTGAGRHYLIYSFSPGVHVLNGFIQSLIGLHDLTVLGNDSDAQSLFAAGNAEARVEVPHYDTGAWSLYDQVGESDFSYHELLRDFLFNLCARTRADASGSAAAIHAALHGQNTASSLGLTGHARASDPSGGAGAPGNTGAPAPSQPAPAGLVPTVSPGDAIYCTTGLHFLNYEHTAPVIRLLSTRASAGHGGQLRFTLSKISSVHVSVSRGAYSASLTLAHGTHTLSWTAPSSRGGYTFTVTATDLAGNSGRASGTLTVS